MGVGHFQALPFSTHQMETPLRQLLRSLCHNTNWKYAVLWKVKHRSRMLLTWEDGYCDYPKPRDTRQNLTQNVCFEDGAGMDAFDYEIKASGGSPMGYSVGMAVANMSYLVYSLGEGIVGRVAFSAKHYWIVAEKFSSADCNSKFVPEYPDEWQIQFAAGIKTIALIPVLPQGVVQLGSLEMVAEDLKLVAHIKDLFSTLQNDSGASLPFMSSENFPDPLPFTSVPYSAASSAITDGPPIQTQPKPAMTEPEVLDAARAKNELSSVSPHNLMRFMVQDDPPVSQSNMQRYVFGTDRAHSTPDQLSGNGTYRVSHHKIRNGTLIFPADSELHKALVPAFQKEHNPCVLEESTVTGEGIFSSSSAVHLADFPGTVEPLVGDFGLRFMEGSSSEHLLDAVVANVCYVTSDENVLCTPSGIKSPSGSSGQYDVSCLTESNLQGGADDSDIWSYAQSVFVSGCGEVSARSSMRSQSNEESMLSDERQQQDLGSEQSKRGVGLSQVSKRRARPGEIQRPRPRDRQQIQDRVKELREIVPNGAKCSIDTLLEQTIKHMQFLRSITSQADKLSNYMQPKMVDNESWSTFGMSSHQNSSSWALEWGSKPGFCPVVVQNLSHPCHLLVEMLCEEHGLFLEIAQVLRRLGLTILKGVMESRSDKIWAHFIVEATRGFQRMDILGPLMQLVQPSIKSNPYKV